MTDGYNTSGVDPVAAAERLRDIGVRVHVIPAGADVSETQLGSVAATTSGDLLPAPSLNDLPAIYAELAGRHRGAAMALPRLNSRAFPEWGERVVKMTRPLREPTARAHVHDLVEERAKSLQGLRVGPK